jgi:hypothetical protein
MVLKRLFGPKMKQQKAEEDSKVRNAHKILARKSEAERPLWKIILNGILKEQHMRVWTGFLWLSTGTSRRHL